MVTPEPEAPLAETVHEASKDARAAIVFVIIMALVQLISVTIYTINATKDRNEEMHQQTLNRQFQILEKLYEKQDSKYKEIEYPLLSLRGALEQIYIVCHDSNLSAADKKTQLGNLKQTRFKDKILLVQAYTGSQILFGNELFEKLLNLARIFESTEIQDNNQLCSAITPEYQSQIKNENLAINQIILKKIDETESTINSFISKENIK